MDGRNDETVRWEKMKHYHLFAFLFYNVTKGPYNYCRNDRVAGLIWMPYKGSHICFNLVLLTISLMLDLAEPPALQ